MKRKIKISIFVMLSIIFLVSIVLIVKSKINKLDKGLKQEYNEYNNNYVTLNNRFGITNQVEFDNLLYYNVRLTVDADVCVFEGDVKNLTSNSTNEKTKKVIFKDDNNNEVGSIKIYLMAMQSEETTHFYTQTEENFKNAYSFEVVDIE